MDRPLAVPINYHIQLSEVPLPPVSWGQGGQPVAGTSTITSTITLFTVLLCPDGQEIL